MRITEGIGKLLDTAGSGIGKVFAHYKIGGLLHSLNSDFDTLNAQNPSSELISKELIADDITGGVATVTSTLTGGIGAFEMPLVISSTGAPRAITKIEVDATNTKLLKITATSVAATDIVTVRVYEAVASGS